jgi:hypothetical protein
MKPVGKSGISATDPMKNSVPSTIVFTRCRMLQFTQRM